MKLVVTGLSPREETAFGIFLDRALRHWTWQSAAAGRGVVLPPADLIVADLVSLGLGHWSEEAEADLLRLLQGTPAVLLLPSHDHSWATMAVDTATQPALVWLAKPYGTKEMQAALEQAEAAIKQRTRRAAPPPQTALMAPPVPPTQWPVSPIAEVPGLTAAGLRTWLAALPADGRHVFLRKLSVMLSWAHPFEVRFTVQNSLIVHPADGWVASNTPMLVIKRVCQSDTLATALEFREIDSAQAEERMERLGMRLRELDVSLWELAATTLGQQPAPPGTGSTALKPP
jgi:hypothetical protein